MPINESDESVVQTIGPARWAIVETGYCQGGIDTCSCLFRKTQIIPKETPTNPTVHYAVKDPASERPPIN